MDWFWIGFKERRRSEVRAVWSAPDLPWQKSPSHGPSTWLPAAAVPINQSFVGGFLSGDVHRGVGRRGVCRLRPPPATVHRKTTRVGRRGQAPVAVQTTGRGVEAREVRWGVCGAGRARGSCWRTEEQTRTANTAEPSPVQSSPSPALSGPCLTSLSAVHSLLYLASPQLSHHTAQQTVTSVREATKRLQWERLHFTSSHLPRSGPRMKEREREREGKRERERGICC